jgi:hypothetical protein
MSLPDELQALTGRLLAVRNSNASLTADVSRGLSATTERYAYPYTVPATASLHYPAMVTGATRALAMVAMYKRTPNSSATLGSNFAHIPGAGDGVGERLALIVDLDVEQAVQVLDGLVGRSTAVNFYALVELLTFWDTGDIERDIKYRSRLVYDFYARPAKTSVKKEVQP